MNKLNIYRALRIALIIVAIVVAVFVVRKFYSESKMKNLANDVITQIKTTTENSETGEVIQTIDAEMGGYKVVGIIKIPKIDLEYPILEKTNKESLNISITKFWGNEINEIGNVTLAGHNNFSRSNVWKNKKISCRRYHRTYRYSKYNTKI